MSGQRVALVTGAAGGIGVAIVAALEADGWTVAATDLDGVSAPSARPMDLVADLASRTACASLVERTLAGYGRLDLLVNNAATMTLAEPTAATMDLWWRDFQVNLTAPVWLVQAAAPALHQTRGQVINMCSISALRGEPGFSAYAASKSALLGLTRSLARELAPAVRVNALAPGPTDTPQLARDAEFQGLTMPELHAYYAAQMPIGRLVAPGEVAASVAFLAGSAAFTGECIQVNGGMLMA
ncbi:MAG TPA: SDR family oxidoreductase [Trebonia sp.]|nr:SDR family oxidoreductase [Trebonia sp.]